MGEDGVVVGLNDSDWEGKSGEDILDKSFGRIGGHFFMELDEAQAGTAVNGGELIEFSAFNEIWDEFDIDLQEIPWARDGEGSAVAFRAEFSFAGQPVALKNLADGKSGRDFRGGVV